MKKHKRKVFALLILTFLATQALQAIDFKTLWKCRPGAKSNKECSEKEREKSKKWVIGGTVALGAAALGAIAGGAGSVAKSKKGKIQQGFEQKVEPPIIFLDTLNRLDQSKIYEKISTEKNEWNNLLAMKLDRNQAYILKNIRLKLEAQKQKLEEERKKYFSPQDRNRFTTQINGIKEVVDQISKKTDLK